MTLMSEEEKNIDNGGKSPDQQWAEKLGVPFNEDRNQVPPPVPSSDPNNQVPPPQPPRNPAPQPQNQAPQQPQRFSGFPLRNSPVEISEPMPPTYLVWSILCTLLCCFIPGIIAIFFSSKVSSRYYAGDMEGARKSSRRAEIWIIVSFVLGMLTNTLYIPLMMVSGN